MVDVTGATPMHLIGQKIVELSEDMRQLLQDTSEAMAECNLNTAPGQVVQSGKLMLTLTKALEQVNKSYLIYKELAAAKA